MSILELFPNLRRSHYIITSSADVSYNCIAWALGETDTWWWPDSLGFYYWPRRAPRRETIDAFEKTFQLLELKPTHDGRLEDGVEKIALYAADENPTHAARQLVNGFWTSKLGKAEDIEHELTGLEGKEFGRVIRYFKRKRRLV